MTFFTIEFLVFRSLPDIRHQDCKHKKYLSELNTVSVVVPFHNEHLSTLLRTAISVINRSPPQLLKQVILVDDFSSKSENNLFGVRNLNMDFFFQGILKDDLDDYVKKYLPLVQIIRLPERMGLIRARLAGARAATSDVLVFLDSHSEANVNWLPPLLGESHEADSDIFF